MKIIINKETTISSGEKLLTYNDLLKIVINNPPQGGFTISDMRDRLRIWELLNATNISCQLEDSDFKILKEQFDNFKWAQSHKDIIELADQLEQLTK